MSAGLIPSERGQYNQLFTIHGTIMILLFATPASAGFANAVMSVQNSSPDVAFPRSKAFTSWVYLLGGKLPCRERG